MLVGMINHTIIARRIGSVVLFKGMLENGLMMHSRVRLSSEDVAIKYEAALRSMISEYPEEFWIMYKLKLANEDMSDIINANKVSEN